LLASPSRPVTAAQGAAGRLGGHQLGPVLAGQVALMAVLSPLMVNLPPFSAATVPTAYEPTSDRLSPNDTCALYLTLTD
jgi:hypothetical protein